MVKHQTANEELASLNLLPSSKAGEELLKCCGSREWALRMVGARPFESQDDLIAKADRIWRSLEPPDWLEAFRAHPKIGEKEVSSKVSNEMLAWSEQEQSGTGNSLPATMKTLAELNRKYEEQFGYIFIVCATGKSAEQMLALLRERLKNRPEKELFVAAAEQAAITRLRLKKLLDKLSP
jgi:OHCU decarboxylase